MIDPILFGPKFDFRSCFLFIVILIGKDRVKLHVETAKIRTLVSTTHRAIYATGCTLIIVMSGIRLSHEYFTGDCKDPELAKSGFV